MISKSSGQSPRKIFCSSAEVIIALLNGPKELEELARITKRTIKTLRYRTIPPLKDRGIIKEIGSSVYALSSYSEEEGKVDDALKQYKEMGYDQVSLKDLANKVGIPPDEIEKFAYRLAPKYRLEIGWESRRKTPTSLWGRLKFKLEQVGGNLAEVTIQRATRVGRDPRTGWPKYDYGGKTSIKGIMILKGAIDLISAVAEFKIYFDQNKYAGIFLTADSVEHPDHIWWKGKLYEVRNVEERLEGDRLSYRVAQLARLVLSRG